MKPTKSFMSKIRLLQNKKLLVIIFDTLVFTYNMTVILDKSASGQISQMG